MLVKSKILIIDASESTRTFMRFILGNSGFRITVTATAARALEEIEEQLFDVVLVDLRLPDMDGLELIREIRSVKAFEATPIVSVIQMLDAGKEDEQAAAGVTHWINQPVSPHKLIEIITEISPDPEEYDDDMVNDLINQNK